MELILLCGPAIALLALGIIFLPTSLTALIFSPSNSGVLPIVALITACGAWGTISLASLARYAYSKERSWPGRPIQWFGILLGLAACSVGLLTSTEHYIISIVFAGPIITTAHLLYLSRLDNMAS